MSMSVYVTCLPLCDVSPGKILINFIQCHESIKRQDNQSWFERDPFGSLGVHQDKDVHEQIADYSDADRYD